MKAYDVMIIGGGPAGGTLSLLLAQVGISVAVIDHLAPEEVLKDTFDGRTTALSAGSMEILKKSGAWEALSLHTEPIKRIFVSQKGGRSHLEYGPKESGREAMGYIVENRLFRKAFFDQFKYFKNIKFHAPAKVSDLRVESGKVLLSLKNEKLSAPLCVGADGRHSFVQGVMKTKVREIPYRQSAIVFNVSISKPHDGIAFEHFLPSGPLAFLPMSGHRCSVVWSVKDDLCKILMSLDDDDFSKELQHHFGDGLGDLKILTKRWIYPMSLRLADSLISPRLALVGDAAHVIHPVAGQGLNLGFRDVERLADLITTSHQLGLDLGSMTVLNEYQKDRQLDILSMSAITHSLVRLFSNNLIPLKQLRGIGMAVTNKIPPLKRLLTRHAMGLLGR